MIRVVHLGLGEIGKRSIAAMLAQGGLVKVVGVVDPHPALVGKGLREVMGRKDVPALKVMGTMKELLKGADVVTMTTGSRTVDVRETLEQCIRAGVHVVSTCEELAFPMLRAAKITASLNRLAKKHTVAILGTGVNPGFAMDGFALACTAPCAVVRGIRVLRSLDATKRRLQLQKKVGAGMTVAAVKGLIAKGAIGHVGLKESCAMIAAGLGWKLDAMVEKFEPVVATESVASEFIHVEAGQVRGMKMTCVGTMKKKRMIELELVMAFGAETFDEVQVEADPPVVVRTTTGFAGEASTVGMLANCVRVVGGLEPGVRTMLDVFRVRGVGEENAKRGDLPRRREDAKRGEGG